MVNELEAKLLRNALLQFFDVLVTKFVHFAGFNIDQMIMMFSWNFLVARPTVAEIVALQDSCLFEQTNCAIDSGDRDMRIKCVRPAVQLFDIGVISGSGQHARNHASLFRHPQALIDAELFDAIHNPSCSDPGAHPLQSLAAHCRRHNRAFEEERRLGAPAAAVITGALADLRKTKFIVKRTRASIAFRDFEDESPLSLRGAS